MADTIQMNANVQKETKARVDEMARVTFRSPGKVLDWVVDEAYKKFQADNTQPVEPVKEPTQ